MKPTIGEWNIKYKNRRVVLTRLHMGLTYITHHHLLDGSESLRRSICKKRLTVKHILIEGVKLNQVWKKYYPTNNLKKTLYENNIMQDSQFFKRNWNVLKSMSS